MMYILGFLMLFSSATTCETFSGSKKTFAKFTYWGFHIYDLEYSSDEAFPSSPFALELKYKKNFKGKKIADVSEEEMERIGAPAEKLKPWTEQMTKIFPDVKPGESIRGFVDKDKKTFFCQNNKSLGEISDPEFATYFFGIWLSEKSRQPGLRKQLMGEKRG